MQDIEKLKKEKGQCIIAAIVVAMIGGCLCSCNNMKRPDNGHDYDLEPMQSTAMRHSPNCRKCKEIRRQEIIEVVDSMIRDRIRIEVIER
jgi:hypothetical protein